MLAVKLLADIVWAVHFFMLWAYSGCSINILCGVRETVYLIDNDDRRQKLWITVFMIAGWVSAAVTWNGMASLMPTAAVTAATYSFWQKSITVTRVIAFVVAVFMLIYDLFVGSYSDIVNETLTIISAVIALIRHKKVSCIK